MIQMCCFLYAVQIAGLTKGELEWLANHMGHEVSIHEAIYRLQDSTVEMAKVSRLLMAVDAGKIREFAGKTLNQTEMTGWSLIFRPNHIEYIHDGHH